MQLSTQDTNCILYTQECLMCKVCALSQQSNISRYISPTNLRGFDTAE